MFIRLFCLVLLFSLPTLPAQAFHSKASLPQIVQKPTSKKKAVTKSKPLNKRVTVPVVGKAKASRPLPPNRRPKTLHRDLHYGIAFHPLSQASPIDIVIDEQIQLLKELGIEYVKTENLGTLGDAPNDLIINKLVEAGLKPIIIVDWQQQNLDVHKLPLTTIEKDAYTKARNLAERYKGKVAYYQAAPELSNIMLRSPYLKGIDLTDYDDELYARFSTWLKGTLRGIRDGDPLVKRMIVDQYLHVGILDRLERDHIVDYEAIGWDLYSDHSTNLDNMPIPDTNQYYDVLGKLLGVAKGREIWLAEVSVRDGTSNGLAQPQAQYLQQVANWAAHTPEIRGIIAYELTDQPEVPGTQANYGFWHLVRQEKNNVVYRIDRPKLAWHIYKSIVKNGPPSVQW